MLKELVMDLLAKELARALTNPEKSENNWPGLPSPGANNHCRDTSTPRSFTMISTPQSGPLFFSPNEEKILEVLRDRGPLKQAAIISALELEMNATTAKELLANLIKRRAVVNGPDGYELIGQPS